MGLVLAELMAATVVLVGALPETVPALKLEEQVFLGKVIAAVTAQAQIYRGQVAGVLVHKD